MVMALILPTGFQCLHCSPSFSSWSAWFGALIVESKKLVIVWAVTCVCLIYAHLYPLVCVQESCPSSRLEAEVWGGRSPCRRARCWLRGRAEAWPCSARGACCHWPGCDTGGEQPPCGSALCMPILHVSTSLLPQVGLSRGRGWHAKELALSPLEQRDMACVVGEVEFPWLASADV